MRTTTFAALGLVTLAVAGGAYWTMQEREANMADTYEKAALYPDLLTRVNDVTGVRIETQANGTLTMTRDGEVWRMAEKHDYRVDAERVSQSLVALASMETLEPKTRKAENYAQLSVEDIPADDSISSRAIRMTASVGDQTAADVLIGFTRPAGIGGGVFVRRVGEHQVYLASGSFQPKTEAKQWLDRNVVNIDSRRVALVTIIHADGDNFSVAKPDIASEDMAYTGLVVPGMQAKPVHEMNAMANVTDFLIFEDVRPADEIDWKARPVVSTYTTYDGVRLVLTAVEDDDGRTWVTAEASSVPEHEWLADFVEENAGQDSMEGRLADTMLSAEDAAAEIKAINERVNGWAYRLTQYKTGKVTIRSSDMLEEASEAPAAEQN